MCRDAVGARASAFGGVFRWRIVQLFLRWQAVAVRTIILAHGAAGCGHCSAQIEDETPEWYLHDVLGPDTQHYLYGVGYGKSPNQLIATEMARTSSYALLSKTISVNISEHLKKALWESMEEPGAYTSLRTELLASVASLRPPIETDAEKHIVDSSGTHHVWIRVRVSREMTKKLVTDFFSANTTRVELQFAWPPPKPSALAVLNLRTVRFTPMPTKLGDVAEALELAFDATGYDERCYYPIPGGFALVTRLEQFDNQGQPLEGTGRWSARIERREVFSILSYLKALFTADRGRFRVFTFVVASEQYIIGASATDEIEVTNNQLRDWLWGGDATLPGYIADKRLTNKHTCTALVYEFEKASPDHAARLSSSSTLTGKQHLAGGGLWKILMGDATGE